MKITSVQVNKVANKGALKAVANITIDDAFAVHGIRVIEGKKGTFILMPSRKAADGKNKSIAYPVTKEAGQAVREAILKAYEAV